MKVAESERPATSFLQPLLEKEEPACACCGLPVVSDADVFTCTGSGRASLNATTLRTKQRLEINSRHEQATFVAACIVLTILGEPLSCLNASADGARRTLAEGCTSELWDQSILLSYL